MAQDSLVQVLKQLDPSLFDRLHREITEERFYRYLKPLADTLAPSQTVAFTRAPLLENLLLTDGILERDTIAFQRNFQGTGNAVMSVGRHSAEKRVWLLAHLDIISYLVEVPIHGRYPLSPLCYHMMHPGRQAGVAVHYDLAKRSYATSACGEIIAERDGGVFFVPSEEMILGPGHRICFHSELTWDRTSGVLSGSLDDSGAAVALVLAAIFLADYGVELMVGLTDEEEGVAGSGNQTICRGGARLLRHFGQPELAIVSDIHEAAPMLEGTGPVAFQPGDGASFTEKASRGRGAVTPPHLYHLQRQLALDLLTEDIHLRENLGGYVSRTEGVNAILYTPNVAIIGFLGEDRHFEKQATTANMRDLVSLAKATVCYVLLTQTPIWSEVLA
jgi:putative aminopeptidase FrvX